MESRSSPGQGEPESRPVQDLHSHDTLTVKCVACQAKVLLKFINQRKLMRIRIHSPPQLSYMQYMCVCIRAPWCTQYIFLCKHLVFGFSRLPIQTVIKHWLFQTFIQQRDIAAVCLSGLKVNSNLLSETRPIKNAADSETRQRPRPNQFHRNLPGWTVIYLWPFSPSIQIAICIIIIREHCRSREHSGLNQTKQANRFCRTIRWTVASKQRFCSIFLCFLIQNSLVSVVTFWLACFSYATKDSFWHACLLIAAISALNKLNSWLLRDLSPAWFCDNVHWHHLLSLVWVYMLYMAKAY